MCRASSVPNPRVILPRRIVPNVITGAGGRWISAVSGCGRRRARERSRLTASWGCFIVPPALAWLWRLVAPRGHANPSIVATEGLSSEGVGSYWPFATGRPRGPGEPAAPADRAGHAGAVRALPNQHIGAWEVGFMPQWMPASIWPAAAAPAPAGRRSSPARCAPLGHAIRQIAGRRAGWCRRICS